MVLCDVTPGWRRASSRTLHFVCRCVMRRINVFAYETQRVRNPTIARGAVQGLSDRLT